MPSDFRVRLAEEPDLGEIMEILRDRRDWLRETKHSDQWAAVDRWRDHLSVLVGSGEVWVLVTSDDQELVVGTVSVGTEPDTEFWNQAERSQPALYLAKLATDVAYQGRELGRRLLDWTLVHAAARGVGLVRLDTWKSSRGLHDYYRDRG